MLPTDFVTEVPVPATYLAWRRRIECVVLILCAPIIGLFCILIAALIRMDSPGSALFRQRRPGIGTTTFDIWKFRTMHVASRGPGSERTMPGDKRITRVGRILRRTHLDELPQFWNVLRGEMTLIGPRPEPLSNTAVYERAIAEFRLRRCVLPGITGLAQVQLGYTDDVDGARKKAHLDLQYVRHASPLLDARILVRTMWEMISGRVSR